MKAKRYVVAHSYPRASKFDFARLIAASAMFISLVWLIWLLASN